MTTRRDFLKLLGVGTAGVTLSAAGLYLPEAEPVRRYWQVGASLSRPSTELAEYYRELASGTLSPHPNMNVYTDENGRLFSPKELTEISILVKGYQDLIMASRNSKS